MRELDRSLVHWAHNDVRSLEEAFSLYRGRTGHYPEAPGFPELIRLNIIEREPRDPWGSPYRYALVDGRPVITSYGKDRRPGGTGPAADISNSLEDVSSR